MLRLIPLIAFVLTTIDCTEHKRSLLYAAGKERTLRIDKLTIQTFETNYDRQEIYLGNRLVGYVGSNYLIKENENDGHTVLPVWPEKIRDAPVVHFGVGKRKGFYPWYLYVSPKKFSRDDYETVQRLLKEITTQHGPVIHQAYYLAGVVYYHYDDLTETYTAEGDKRNVIQVTPEGKVLHVPDLDNPEAGHFLGELAGGQIAMKRYWVKDLDFSRFRLRDGKKFSEAYTIVYTEGM